jgi:hypothetical protein
LVSSSRCIERRILAVRATVETARQRLGRTD